MQPSQSEKKNKKPNAFIDEDDDEEDYKENPRSSQIQSKAICFLFLNSFC